MPTPIAVRRTDTVGSDQRYIDLSKEINLLEPDAAPIKVITSRLASRAAGDPLFSWMEDELEGRSDAINNGAGYNNSATSIVVDTGTLFAVDDLVKVPRTGEVFLVTAISTNTLTVVRGVSGSGAAALVDNDPLYIIGTAAEEGGRSFAARQYNPTKSSNYTQIFKNSVEASGTELSASNQTRPHDWPYQQKKIGIEHVKDIELAFLLGKPSSDAGDSPDGDRRTTGGVLHFLTQNNTDAGGTLTEAELETWVRTLSRYGGKKRTVFASPLVVSVINNFAVNRLQVVQSDHDKTYGLSVMNYVSPHGEFNIVKHNLLEVGVYTGYAIAIDFGADVAYRYLDGDGPGPSRDTKLLTDREETDRDGRKDEYLTECGLQLGETKRHGVLTGVTG